MPKFAFVGSRLEYLQGKLAVYVLTQPEERDTFVADVVRWYLRRFPWNLDPGTERTAAELAAVNDDVADEEAIAPVPGAPDFGKATREKKKRDDYKNKIAEQIRRWFPYHAKPKARPHRREDNKDQHLEVMRGRLTGMGIQKPRKLPAHLVWARDNKDIVKAFRGIAKSDRDLSSSLATNAIDAKTATAEKEAISGESGIVTETKQGKRKANIAVVDYQTAVKRGFEELPEDEKEEWDKKADGELKDALEKWKEIMSGPASTTAEDRQRCIDALPAFIAPVLELIFEHTGLVCGFWAAGPEPVYGGKPSVISASAGKIPGPAGQTFKDSERKAWKETIVPIIGRFVRKVYSVQECRARALPSSCDDNMKQLDREDRKVEVLEGWTGIDIPNIPQGAARETPAPVIPSSDPSAISEADEVTPGGDMAVSPASTPPGSPTLSALSRRSSVSSVVSATSDMLTDSQEEPSLAAKPVARRSSRQSSASSKGNLRLSSSNSSTETRNVPPPSTPSTRRVASEVLHASNTGTSLEEARHAVLSRMLAEQDQRKRVRMAEMAAVRRAEMAAAAVNPAGASTPAIPPVAPHQASPTAADPVGESVTSVGSSVDGPEIGKADSLSPDEARRGSKRKVEMGDVEPAGKEGNVSNSHKRARPRLVGSSDPESYVALPECPSGAPEYVSKVLQICAVGPQDAMWYKVVWGWFGLDQAAGFEGKGKLGTAGRPEAIAAWIARARHPKWRPNYLSKDRPTELKVDRFATDFAAWWKGLQAGRKECTDSFIGMSRLPGANWDALNVRGPNGIVSLLVALAWWREAVEALPATKNRDRQKKEEQESKLKEALGEVDFAFGEMKLAT